MAGEDSVNLPISTPSLVARSCGLGRGYVKSAFEISERPKDMASHHLGLLACALAATGSSALTSPAANLFKAPARATTPVAALRDAQQPPASPEAPVAEAEALPSSQVPASGAKVHAARAIASTRLDGLIKPLRASAPPPLSHATPARLSVSDRIEQMCCR